MTGRRDIDHVIEWSKGQITHPDRSYKGLCQSHCRTAYNVPAWSPSAKAAWEHIPHNMRHAGGKPSDAPRGALLYYDTGNYGHVAIAIGKDGRNCLSNDYARSGRIDVVPRTFSRWGEHYVGWSSWTPFGHYDLTSGLWVPKGR